MIPRRPGWRVLAASCLLCSMVAAAETVYRCDNRYSQSPCNDAHVKEKVLNIDDSRDAAQKAATDAATRKSEHLAQQLEQARLQQEFAAPRPSKATARSKTATKKPKPTQDQLLVIHPKRPKLAAHKPKDFTARVPEALPSKGHTSKAQAAAPVASR